MTQPAHALPNKRGKSSWKGSNSLRMTKLFLTPSRKTSGNRLAYSVLFSLRSRFSSQWHRGLGAIALGIILTSLSVPNLVAADRDTQTPIKHVIYLMQENHSFDNYFGTYPGADGIPAGTCMPLDPDAPNETDCVEPFHIGNRAITDLGHSSSVYREQLNGGRMDGFVSAHLKRNAEGRLAMGYYDDRDLPFYWNIADQYVLFDRFFTSAIGGSVWNHNYWVAGAPGSERNSVPEEGYGDDFITIFDRLEEHDISWKFYVQNYDPRLTYRTMGQGGAKAAQIIWVPLLNIPRFLDDPHLFGKIVHLDEYYEDLRAGTLPAVAYIVPSGASEHPPGSIRAGQAFVKTLIHELMKSSAWEESAFIWTYDDWGGWYDHVKPPEVDAYGYGFRAPALLVSPYAKKGYIDSTEYDFTSPIKFITENWGLPSLAARDAQSNNMHNAFDFSTPRPPAFVASQRPDNTPKQRPKSAPVYWIYMASVLLASLIIGGAFRQSD